MRVTRRRTLRLGGGFCAALWLPFRAFAADDIVEVEMRSGGNGARVWFDPVGLRIEPGQTVRWVNRDKGNTHTTTAYHPAHFNRPRRMPEGAKPWNSGYLLPGRSFSITLSEPGVYDYFCIPHEAAGMVGRIIVGEPGTPEWLDGKRSGARLPGAARTAFPSVEEIMASGTVRPG